MVWPSLSDWVILNVFYSHSPPADYHGQVWGTQSYSKPTEYHHVMLFTWSTLYIEKRYLLALELDDLEASPDDILQAMMDYQELVDSIDDEMMKVIQLQ